MVFEAATSGQQLPLIVFVERDDVHLASREDVLWFAALRGLDWRIFADVASRYYDALHGFNIGQAQRRAAGAPPPNPETAREAQVRLISLRPTQGGTTAVLVARAPAAAGRARLAVRPGVTPVRLAGRQPKCFFAMLWAFLGMKLRGFGGNAEEVEEELRSNPAFARTCGFTLPDAKAGYRQSDVPGLRKLEQFDQIMSDAGLWGAASAAMVRANVGAGRVALGPDTTLVHDTTHYAANSVRQYVELPPEPAAAPRDLRKGGRPRKERTGPEKKSHSKPTKACRCADRAACGHAWSDADEGAGVVHKPGKAVWAHKASTIAVAGRPEILLDAQAVMDAASHDGNTLLPHVERLWKSLPELAGNATRILDDGAADSAPLKKALLETYGLELLAPVNPRTRRDITKDLPRGMAKITPRGVPQCAGGYPLDFASARTDTKRYVFQAPDGPDGAPVCAACPLKASCCHPGSQRRHVTIPFARLPWIDPAMPQLSARFERAMAKRTVIERLHKRMKYDFGDENLLRRGNKAFQGTLDKTLLAMHVALATG